jgi:hypothetical protein
LNYGAAGCNYYYYYYVSMICYLPPSCSYPLPYSMWLLAKDYQWYWLKPALAFSILKLKAGRRVPPIGGKRPINRFTKEVIPFTQNTAESAKYVVK